MQDMSTTAIKTTTQSTWLLTFQQGNLVFALWVTHRKQTLSTRRDQMYPLDRTPGCGTEEVHAQDKRGGRTA